jgi:hypothetical protein
MHLPFRAQAFPRNTYDTYHEKPKHPIPTSIPHPLTDGLPCTTDIIAQQSPSSLPPKSFFLPASTLREMTYPNAWDRSVTPVSGATGGEGVYITLPLDGRIDLVLRLCSRV